MTEFNNVKKALDDNLAALLESKVDGSPSAIRNAVMFAAQPDMGFEYTSAVGIARAVTNRLRIQRIPACFGRQEPSVREMHELSRVRSDHGNWRRMEQAMARASKKSGYAL